MQIQRGSGRKECEREAEITGDWASKYLRVCIFGEGLLQLTSSCSGPRMRVSTNSNSNNNNNNNNRRIDIVKCANVNCIIERTRTRVRTRARTSSRMMTGLGNLQQSHENRRK